ncbi:HTH domain-containing protein [Natrinema amylolyticum]|uniref:HTH domain-containing protein n=1 Tax=Natrinema amylolyticum TaxID=2878679 RepID=UPI001CFB2033|nr:HTH domain-containing protein [Natrinema amylolyticum]
MTDKTSEITAVCHVRAPLLLEPVDAQIETLQACESEGAIDDLLLRSWPKEVSLSAESPHQEVLENYERFAEWADERGVTVRPPFRERSTTSQVTGETRELLVTPLLCLELYADDELVGVFPHSDEATEDTYTTDEAIATLRTGELPTPLGSVAEADEDLESATTDTCPDCGGSLIDGQGLFGCSDCGWVGTVTEFGRYEPQSDRSAEEREPSVAETR